MIPVGEFRNFASEANPQFRVLKPWWDVFSEYLCIAMLMIGVFGCTLQLTQDRIACLPRHLTGPAPEDVDCSHIRGYRENETLPAIPPLVSPATQEVFGRKNDLDIHQYVFVNNYCYENAVHWYGKYFPYLVLVHTMVFMVASGFWFKFPGTSSKIELFCIILGKCFNSPWTTRALSEVSEERSEEKLVTLRKSTMSKLAWEADEETVGLLRPSSPAAPAEPDRAAPEPQTAASVLDRKEGEQAKALFEKVKKFRTHVEDSELLRAMYVVQTCLKVANFLLITVYGAMLVPCIEVVVRCAVPPELTGFHVFCCNHNKAHLFSKLAYCYLCLVGAYGLLCVYTLYWLFHRPLKEYRFEHVRLETGMDDIPDVRNDFAFLLHLSDQYDALYAKRFAVFLSEVSESRLRQANLNHEWPVARLRARLARNAGGRLELHLLALPGLPDAVFQLAELEVLRLELLGDVTVPAAVVRLSRLRELALVRCPARLQLAALAHLREWLKVLKVDFSGAETLPPWMYTLRGLEELHLRGPLAGNASHGDIALDSLRELKALRSLTLHGSLPAKLPPGLGDAGGGRLQRLSVHGEGSQLRAFSALKKLSGGLQSLELCGCGLERIPSAVFSLAELQELDLRDNRLATVEEILSLQHCRRLTTLRLWHNSISYVPEHVSRLLALETLDLSWNRLRRLPARLCYCTRLRHLDVSHNQLAALPPEMGVLQGLQTLRAASNQLEALPDELFSCRRLRTLALGGNRLEALSSRVGNLAQLVRLEVGGNPLEALPPEVADCPLLALSGVAAEDELLARLPPDVREKMTHR